VHNNFGKIEFNLATIAEYAGLNDSNQWNLATTVETNILDPLKEYGYINSYEMVGEDAKSLKYIIRRSGPDINGKTREEAGSVKDVVGSVKRNRC
jgi:ribosomal protein S8